MKYYNILKTDVEKQVNASFLKNGIVSMKDPESQDVSDNVISFSDNYENYIEKNEIVWF